MPPVVLDQCVKRGQFALVEYDQWHPDPVSFVGSARIRMRGSEPLRDSERLKRDRSAAFTAPDMQPG